MKRRSHFHGHVEISSAPYEALGGQYLINQRGEPTPERDGLNRERSCVRALAAFALASLFRARKQLLVVGT